MNSLLYGHNPEERVVAVEQLNDQKVRLFKRIEGKVLHKDVDFFPFFFLSDQSLLAGYPNNFWLKELSGNNFYKYIAAFQKWSEMWEAIRYIIQKYNKLYQTKINSYLELKEVLLRPDPVRQFLLQSGTTMFKGMQYDELVILYIDILAKPNEKSKSKTKDEDIIIISLLSKNGEYSIKFNKGKQEKSLNEFLQIISKTDPDFIVGYGNVKSNLSVLAKYLSKYNLPLEIGRLKNKKASPLTPTIQSENPSISAFGRYIIDLSELLESEFNLKKSESPNSIYFVAKFNGITYNEDIIIQGNNISKEWKLNPEKVISFSKQNVQLIKSLSDIYLPFTFNLSQICPFDIRLLMRTGPYARIESLILREYVRQKHSVPCAPEVSRAISIPSEIFYSGIYKDVYYIKISELYPELILDNNIKPKNDQLNVFTTLIKEIKSRSEKLMDKTVQKNVHTTHVDAFNYLLDCFHQYLGYPKGLFADPEQAEKLNNLAKDVFKEIIKHTELFNATIIQTDANGFFLLMPDNVINENDRSLFLDRLSQKIPHKVKLIIKSYYPRMLSFKRGNYAVIDANNNMHIRGTYLIPHGVEKYIRTFNQRVIECLLTEDFKRLHHAYASAYIQIVKHKWTVFDFCKEEIAPMDTSTYKEQMSRGSISPLPAMEAVLNAGLYVKEGDKILYYFTDSEGTTNKSLNTKIAQEWNSSIPDEKTGYYLSRLQETINKYKELFEEGAFNRIFTLDEIFGFSDEKIRVQNRRISEEPSVDKLDIETHKGIWLEEPDGFLGSF